MEKKKILLVLNLLGSGGVAKSLINFVKNFSDEFDIDVALFRMDGDLMEDLPPNANIIHVKGNMKYCHPDVKRHGFERVKMFFIKAWNKVFSNRWPVRYMCLTSQKLKGYDIVISYAQPVQRKNLWCGASEYTLFNTKAKKKYVMTHDSYNPKVYTKSVVKQLAKFDKILAVSKSGMEALKKNIPEIADKCDYIYNSQEVNEIRELSKKEVEPLEGNFKIVSLCRLSEAKGVPRSLDVMKRLKDDGFDFVWTIVGDGELRKEVEEKIKALNLEDNVKLIGNKLNPYPYLKQADLFYLGSLYEAAPVVYGEAMLLRIPVLTTETSSAQELVGDLGFVCENSEEAIYNEFKKLLENKDLIAEKKKGLDEYEYLNDQIREKIRELVK